MEKKEILRGEERRRCNGLRVTEEQKERGPETRSSRNVTGKTVERRIRKTRVTWIMKLQRQ